ncbi:MAG: hypothetical protein ACTSWR_11365 [Candidatus Helarchaeota archaeon]
MKALFKIKLISIFYIIAGIFLFVLGIGILILHIENPSIIINVIKLIFKNGGFCAGDTFITIAQIYATILFLIPMSQITAFLSLSGGILALKSKRKIAWYLIISASILYCLVFFGLIVDYIFLQNDIKEIFNI